MTESKDRAKWLQGPKAQCPTHRPASGRAYRLALLGPPGCGKGTQAAILSEALGACHLSTGDIFRNLKTMDPSTLGPATKEALAAMKRGELVSDETVIQIVAERIDCLQCDCGFLLDGFPRTITQAETLDKLLNERRVAIDAVVNYELKMETVIARLSGRRTCRDCKSTFHIATMPPKTEGVCDNCGGELYQREDDRPDSIRVRLEAYEASTAPLIAFYKEKGKLLSIPAEGEPEQIAEETLEELKALA